MTPEGTMPFFVLLALGTPGSSGTDSVGIRLTPIARPRPAEHKYTPAR
jgi:hypothetical protein